MATIVRYNPWNEMATLNRFFGQWMDEAVGGGTSRNNWNGNGSGFDMTPALDVKENNEGFEIKAELPGWEPDHIDVTIERGVLTLKGELNDETNESTQVTTQGTKWHSREIRRASFVRSFTLPAEVQSDKAVAHFENGVLTLTLPKAEVVKPKQIKIQMSAGNGNADNRKAINSK